MTVAYPNGANGVVIIESTKAGAVTEAAIKAALKGQKDMEFGSFKVKKAAKQDA